MWASGSLGGMNRRVLLASVLALSLALLLAACAPAATGSGPGSAYDIRAQDIRAAAGGTVYVEAHFTFDDLGVDPSKLSGNLWFPTGVNARSAVITPKFTLQNVDVPAGWQLKLVQVTATQRTIAGARTFDKSTTRDDLAVVLQASPPDTAVAGPYWLKATLAYGKTSQPLTVALSVVR